MDKATAEKKIARLSERIHYYNDKYYQEDVSEISDREFDALLHELIALEKEHPEFIKEDSPSQRVGGTITKNFNTVVHEYPMLSLGNTYSEDDLKDFDKRVAKILETDQYEYFCELKFDGVAISLRYQDGVLKQAVTRGDGTQGDDITANARTIRTLPLRIKGEGHPDKFEVRGEVFMPNSVFLELNAQREQDGEAKLANPRNTASGTLKMQDSSVVAARKLDCYLYSLYGTRVESHEEAINLITAMGFNVSQTYRKCSTMEEVLEYITYWESRRHELPLETDGIVIKVNDTRQQEILGYTSKNPRWAISYKYQAASETTRLNDIVYQVGRTGAVTPVAELEPVLLAGTIVKRASLYNANEITRLDLHRGDTVHVEKGGEIIPKVTGVDLEKRDAGSIPFQYIKNCPECDTPLQIEEGEAVHYCPNSAACPPQIQGRIEHFIHRNALNIESLGPETIKGLLSNRLIANYADLYSLSFEEINGLTFEIYSEKKGEFTTRSLREKSAGNIIRSIEKSREVSFPRVLFGLGIRFVGKTVAEKLAEHFKNIDAIAAASVEELEAVHEIGERIAVSVRQFFDQPGNLLILDKLKDAGLQFEIQHTEVSGGSERLAGNSFLISGVFEQYSREELKVLIKQHGGKILSSVTGKLNYLVAGDKMGPSKLEKAEKLGTTVISEAELLNMINAI